MRLTRVVLPQPERPNSATMPGVGASSSARRVKPSRFLRTDTRSILTTQKATHTPRQQLSRQQTQQAQEQRNNSEPQGHGIAAG